MELKVWGARGSIPVSGPEYVRYGGDTTCAELRTDDGRMVILDAGSGLRPLGIRVLEDGLEDIHFLLTHAHWDHLMGFPFFKPLYRKGVRIHFHGCTYAQESVRTFLAATMRPPFFPVNLDDVQATLVFDEECGLDFPLLGMTCRSILLNHPNMGYGFRLTEGDRSVAFFPDNELSFAHPEGGSFEDYREFVRGVDLLVHDAEYTPEEYEAFSRGWGHSIYRDTVRLAAEAEVDRLLLWHLNQERTDDQADGLLEAARARATELGSDVECLMASTGLELTV